MNRYQLETYIPIPDLVNIVLDYMSGVKIRPNNGLRIRIIGETPDFNDEEEEEERYYRKQTKIFSSLSDEEQIAWRVYKDTVMNLYCFIHNNKIYNENCFNKEPFLRRVLRIPGCDNDSDYESDSDNDSDNDPDSDSSTDSDYEYEYDPDSDSYSDS